MENEIRNDFLPVNETEEMNLSKILDDALIKATDTYKTPPPDNMDRQFHHCYLGEL